MAENCNISDMIHEDLIDAYPALYKKYQEMCLISEENTQKKYNLNKALNIAKLTNSHLLQEVEDHWKSGYHRSQNELNDMRKQYNKLELSVKSLQDEHKSLTTQNEQISQQLLNSVNVADKFDNDTFSKESDSDNDKNSTLDYLQILENENDVLYSKLQEYEEYALRHKQLIADCEKSKEILEETVNCLEENLKHNQKELEEKTEFLQNAQEQLAETNAKIASIIELKGGNLDRKGNSLFSQVDDQRQALEELLPTQNKTILEIKTAIVESKDQIRRLKCENDTIITELNKCSSIFCNVDKSFEEELKTRIDQLLLENKQLEDKLELEQLQLKECSIDKGILCFDIYVNMWRKETEGLKQQLFSVYEENAKLAVETCNILQDAARWHLEFIILRWQVAKCENSLIDNNIAFKPIDDSIFQIRDEEVEEAQPRISYYEIKEKVLPKSPKKEIKNEHKEKCLRKEKLRTEESPYFIKNEMAKAIDKEELEKNCKTIELPLIYRDDENNVEVKTNVITMDTAQPLRPVLKMQQGLVHFNENCKNVTFSKESVISDHVKSHGKKLLSTPTPSSTLNDRNKSNLKITRIFINSKKP